MENKRPDMLVASIGENRKKRLQKRAKRRDVTVSELLRRILDEHPETMPPQLAQEARADG